MADNMQDRSYQPTAKRLREAKEEGIIPRSHDLTTFTMLFGAALGLLFLGSKVVHQFTSIMTSCLSMKSAQQMTATDLMLQLKNSGSSMLLILLPFFAGLLIIAITAPMLLGGFHFNMNLLTPRSTRLNPIQGIKRVFSLRSLLELFKAMLKFITIITAALFFLHHHYQSLLTLNQLSIQTALATGGTILLSAMLILSLTLLIFAAIDVPYQLWEHLRQLKMSLHELREEKKITEGPPEVKQRIRKLCTAIAKRAALSATNQSSDNTALTQTVASADVIITSNKHFAVALQYEKNDQKVPTVIAKGTNKNAEKIIQIAVSNQTPIVQSPNLAQSLYHLSTLQREIPSNLYTAVAKVLAYLYQLQHYHDGNADQPKAPDDLPTFLDNNMSDR